MSKLVRKKILSSLIAQGENRDPYIDDVKTLFHFNGSDGQDNSVYLDDSPNKFSMTGGPPNSGAGPYDNQGTFSPFNANGWSHHFSGISGDNAYVDFTSAGIKNYEPWNCSLWFYRDTDDYWLNPTQRGLIQINGVNGTYGSYVWVSPYALLPTPYESYSAWGFQNPGGGGGGGTLLSITNGEKTWNHLLISYDGSQLRVFFNGVNARTQPGINFNTTGNGTINIGRTPNGSGNNWLGFISDVHFENGPAQTSNFTPPAKPAEPTGSTGLLTLNKSVIYDESKYAATPTFGTKFGNSYIRAQPYSPFKSITKEQKSQYYSTYFNGTNQYLTFDPKPNVKGIDFQYDDFSSGAGTPGITYKGSTTFSNNFVYITTSAGGTGGFYREHSQRWDKDFSIEWRFECSGGSGADGFVLQFVQNNIDLGGGGGNCGRVQSSTTIHALTFITFGTDRVIWYKNNVQQQSNNTSVATRSDIRYWFDYNHSAQTGTLYMSYNDGKPATPFVTYSNFVFDSNKYHLMFSAATGGLTDNHILKRLKVHNVEGGDRGLDAFYFASTQYPSAIEAWIYLDGSASSTSDRIICAYGGGAYNWNLTNGLAYTLFVNSNSYLQVNVNAGDGTNANSVTSTTQIIEKQWYHVAVCYMGDGGSNPDAKTMRLFVNGVAEPALVSSSYGTPGRNATFPSSLTVFSVGSSVPHGGTDYFGGYISNLMVSVYPSTNNKLDGNDGTGPLYGGYQGAGIPFRPRIALRQPGFNCTLLTCRDAYLINRATIASALPVAYNNVLTVPFSQATGRELSDPSGPYSWNFDGSAAHIFTSNNGNNVNLGSHYTISFWVRVDTITDCDFFGVHTTTGGYTTTPLTAMTAVGLRYDSSASAYRVAIQTKSYLNSTYPHVNYNTTKYSGYGVNVNEWNHIIVGVASGEGANSLRVILNGRLILRPISIYTSIPQAWDQLIIGASTQGGYAVGTTNPTISNFLDGDIYDFNIANGYTPIEFNGGNLGGVSVGTKYFDPPNKEIDTTTNSSNFLFSLCRNLKLTNTGGGNPFNVLTNVDNAKPVPRAVYYTSPFPVSYYDTGNYWESTGSEIDKFALNGSSHSYYFDGKSYISTQATQDYPINLTSLTESLVEQEGCVVGGYASFISGNLLRLSSDGDYNSGGAIKTKFAQSLNRDFSVKVEMRGSGSSGNQIAQGWSLSFSTDSELIASSHITAPNAPGTTVAQFGFEQYTYNRMFYTNDQNERTNTGLLGGGVWVGTKHYWFDYDHSASTMSVYYASTNSKPATANKVWTGVVMPDQPIYAAINAGVGGGSGNWDLAEWTLYAQNTYLAGKLLDTRSFSLEAWVYRTATSNTSPHIIQLGSSGSNRFAAYITSSNYLELYTNVNGTVVRITDTETFPSERWVHVAITSVATIENSYSPAITSLYKNGKRIGYVDRSIPVCTVAHVGFQGYGTSSNDYWQGYISNIFLSNRVVKYSGETFTVPTEPLIDPDSTSDAISSQCTLLFTGQENTLINKPYLLQGPALRPHGAIQTSKLNPFIGLHNSVEQNYSYYFGSTSTTLTTTNANGVFTFNTNDFTWECWFNRTSTTDYGRVINVGAAWGTTNSTGIGVHGNTALYPNKVFFYVYNINNNAAIIYGSTTIENNKWYHFAVTRREGIFYLWLDGQLEGSYSLSPTGHTETANTNTISLGGNGATNEAFIGYISNVRINNGISLYNSEFNPPTGKLGLTLEKAGSTPAYYTRFLTAQNSTIVDSGPDNFALSNNGTTVSSYNPFTEEPLNEITTAGSLYFSPNVFDHLETSTTSSKFDIRNQACTVDLWFWNPWGQQVTPPELYSRIFAFFDSSATNTWLGIANTYNSSGGFNLQAYSAGTLVINTNVNNCFAQGWNHLAFSKEAAGVFRTFTNGILRNTSTVAYGNILNGLQFDKFSIGGNPKETYKAKSSGFISNVRYIKGECLYKESFTPPSSPTQPIPGTELLLNFNNGAAQDQRGMYNWEVHGDASLSTKQVLFGTSSFYGGTSGRIYFLGDADGTINNFFSSASNSGYNYQNSDFIYTASENFTWEGWYYIDSNAGTAQNLMSIGGEPPSNNGNYRYSLKISTSNILQINVSYVGDTNIGSATVPRREWVHIAWVKVGTTSTFYCNGVSHGTYTRNSTVGNTYSTYAGNRLSHYIGDPNVYVNEFRITKGVARYTSNFTPPSAPFPDR